MKRRRFLLLTFAGAGGIALAGCDSMLAEDVYSQLTPDNVLDTESGIKSVLTSAYGEIQHNSFSGLHYLWLGELPTDILIVRKGGLEAAATPFMNFTWTATHPWLEGTWSRLYRGVRNANMVLDNMNRVDISEHEKSLYEAQARFIRAKAYVDLYFLFGPVPLITSSTLEELDKSRASEKEMKAFIESELRAAAKVLPLVQEEYGRATKGAALGVSAKFLLNTKQWQKTANVAKEVMDLGIYGLVEDRVAMFQVTNERNTEFIYVTPCIRSRGLANPYFPHVAPDNYAFKYPPNEIYGTDLLTPVPFYESFHLDDERRELLITEYINTAGELVPLNYPRSFKYQEDPAATNHVAGNDIPEVRYADVLLSRAEALSELNGPNQESVNLINAVRRVANVPLLSLSNFTSKEQLRDHILQERNWEFYSEGKRREDLIRMGKLIENARARGKNAQPYHVLYPIPQVEMDTNQAMEQNPGY